MSTQSKSGGWKSVGVIKCPDHELPFVDDSELLFLVLLSDLA